MTTETNTVDAAQDASNKAADKSPSRPDPAMLNARGKLPNGGFGILMQLWAIRDAKGTSPQLNGYVMEDGNRQFVHGWFNEHEGKKSVALKKTVAGVEGAGDTYAVVGYGNPVNSNKNGEPVYFDTVVFNIGGQSIGARTPKGTAPELRALMGFTSDMVDRPKKEKAVDGDAAAEGGETQVAAERPRG